MFFIFKLHDYRYEVCVSSCPFHASTQTIVSIVRPFIFSSSNPHLVSRTSGGRLHLIPDVGKIPLTDATLIEEPNDSDREDEMDIDTLSQRTYRSSLSVNEACTVGIRDFKILIENKSNARNCVHLVAPTVQDKEAWISDISQCIDNIHLHSLLSPSDDRASVGGLYGVCVTVMSSFSFLFFFRIWFFPFYYNIIAESSSFRPSSFSSFGSKIVHR